MNNELKNESFFKKHKTKIIYFLIGFFISVLIFSITVLFFIFFIVTLYYQEQENYENYEEINKSEYTLHLSSRDLLSEYQNIEKTNKNSIDFNDIKLKQRAIKEIDNSLLKNSEKHFNDKREITHGSYSYVTEDGVEPIVFNGSFYNLPTVCVQDWFKDGDNHGESIYSYIKSMYNGPIYFIDNNDLDFYVNNEYSFYKECDIVNLSIQYPFIYSKNSFTKNILENIYNEDTIFVYASGNDTDTNSEEVQKMTKHKMNFSEKDIEKYPHIEDKLDTHLIGVTQGIVDLDDNTVKNIFSGGSNIDFVVLNSDLYIHSEKVLGTSYATPFVTAMVANLMQSGVSSDDIKDLLYSNYYLKDDNTTYGVVLADDIQYKINEINKYNKND